MFLCGLYVQNSVVYNFYIKYTIFMHLKDYCASIFTICKKKVISLKYCLQYDTF